MRQFEIQAITYATTQNTNNNVRDKPKRERKRYTTQENLGETKSFATILAVPAVFILPPSLDVGRSRKNQNRTRTNMLGRISRSRFTTQMHETLMATGPAQT